MQKATYLFALLLTSHISHSQSIYEALYKNTQREYRTIKPKQVVETKTYYGPVTKTDKNVKIFDNAGMLLSEEQFDENGTLTFKTTYTNDTLNKINLISTLEIKVLEYGYGKITTYYSYDSNHYLIRITERSEQGRINHIFEITNNEKGKPVELIFYDGDYKPSGKQTATYFNDQNNMAITTYSKDGKLLYTDTIKINLINPKLPHYDHTTYNDKGEPVLQIIKTTSSKLWDEDEFTYDDRGNVAEIKMYIVVINKDDTMHRKLATLTQKTYTY